MANTRLRLLLDESITEPLASWIISLVPSTERSREAVGAGATDFEVAQYANQNRRVIVAIDADFKKLSVVNGVIKFNSPDRATDDCLFAIFRTFWRSGRRSECRGRRVSLTNDGMTIKNGGLIQAPWKNRPCPNL